MANNRPNRPLRPRGGGGAAGRKRRVVIDSTAGRPQARDARQARDRQDNRPKQQAGSPPTGPVSVESGVTVRDFSQALGVPMPQLIKILMNLGAPKTATQSLSDEEVELIAAELQREVTIKHVGEEDEAPEVYDDAVLVVAADDGVMPQTRESIAHARAAEVPIVVAVNKIDLPDANTDRVLAELAQEGLQPEEWGGTTQVSRVSAKQHENLDDLLEKILLVADAELDLRANPNAEASGPIIESRLDVGRGPVATMLIHRGTLKVGDAIVAGGAWGE